MASTKQTKKLTFKEWWHEDLKWQVMVAVFTIPSGLATLAFGIVVLNLYTGWFF